jgi:hypothetical protein
MRYLFDQDACKTHRGTSNAGNHTEPEYYVEKEGSLVDWAIRVLTEPDPYRKVALTHQVVDMWSSGAITEVSIGGPSQNGKYMFTMVLFLGRIW